MQMNIKPVSEGEELNEVSLKRFLQEHDLIKDADSELTVSQFSNGFSNLTYLLNIENNEYVLRRPPFAAPKRGHDMSREYKVIHHLNSVFDKTPQAFAFSEDKEIIGAPFYIMSKVSGEILTSEEARKRQIHRTNWLLNLPHCPVLTGVPGGHPGAQVTTVPSATRAGRIIL